MTVRYDIIIEANDKASKDIKKLNASLKKTDTNAAKAAKAVASIGKSGASAGLNIATTGMKSLAAATVAATAAFLVFGAKSFSAIDSLGKASAKLGVTSRFLSEYGAVANRAGIGQDQFNTGLQRFLRRLGQAQLGTGELIKPLERMGISMTNTNGTLREGTEVFQEFIKKLGEGENATVNLANAVGAFDTEGTAFINIANMGATAIDGIRVSANEAGLVVDDELIAAVERANDAITALTDLGRGFGRQFFGNLAGPLEEFAKDLQAKIMGAIKDSGGMAALSQKLASQFLGGIANMIESIGSLFDGFISAFNKVTNVLKGILSSLPSELTGGVNYEFGSSGANQILQDMSELRKKQKELIDGGAVTGPFLQMADYFGGIAPDLVEPFADGTVELNKINNQLYDLESQLASIESGNTVFLSKEIEESTKLNDKLAGTVNFLREKEKALLDVSAASAKSFSNGTTQTVAAAVIDDGGRAAAHAMVAQDDLNEKIAAAYTKMGKLRIHSESLVAKELENIEKERLIDVRNARIDAMAEEEALLGDGLEAAASNSAKLLKIEKDRLNDVRNAKATAMAENEAAVMTGYEKAAEDAKANTETIAGYWKDLSKDMSSSIARGIMDGKGLFNSFGSYLESWADKVLTKIIEQMLIQPMINQMGSWLGGIGGGLGQAVGSAATGGGVGFDLVDALGSLFSGFHANGGYIPSGKVGIAGEAGAELITGPANVTPLNGEMQSGGGQNVTININAIDTQTGTQFLLDHKREVEGIIHNAYNKRGKQGIYN